MILSNDQIQLRPFNYEDLEILHSWRNDPEIRLLAMQHPYPVSNVLDSNWLQSVLTDVSNKNIVWAIETTVENRLIGYFQLLNINLIHRNAMIGVIIGDKQNRKKGYGEQSIILGISWAFKNIGLRKVYLDVLDLNVSAIKLYQKLGFTNEGKFVKHFYGNGAFHDVLRMALFKD